MHLPVPHPITRFTRRSAAPTLCRRVSSAVAALCLLATAAPAAADDPPTKAVGVEGPVGLADAVAAVDPSIRPPARWALVVGVADYQDERIPDLPACERDARDLATVLTDGSAGLFDPGHVTTLVNGQVTRNAVVAALDELARKAGPDDLVIVFFSGHGATDEKGRAYWVMHDSLPDRLRSTALPELEISELLGEIRTRRLVTIIDACYSAATAQVAATKSLVDLQRLYPDFQGDGRVGMTASKGDQLSMVITDRNDPGFGHSAFTFHVIEGMRGLADARGNADGVVEVDELWSYVKDRTIETSRRQGGNQEPQLKGQVGSRFMLAVDGERLRALAESRRGASRRSDGQLDALRKLFLEEEITAAQYEEARTLLRAPAGSLDERSRVRREAYADLAEGRLAPRHLAAVLDTGGAAPAGPAANGPSAWNEAAAMFAGRWTDIDAPVALAFDREALRDDDRLRRFAEAAASWGVGSWSAANGGTPRQSILLCEPFPATSDTSFLVRGALRRHRGDASLALLADEAGGGERLHREATTSALVAPRTSLTIAGDDEALDRTLGRPANARPGWTASLSTALASAMPLTVVADGPWFVERLRSFPGAEAGGYFLGKIYSELMLPDDPTGPQAWSDSTSGLRSAALTGQPAGEWIRTGVRLDFGTHDEADRAAPGWRVFLFRMAEWAPDATRTLDVQVDGASLVLRLDIRTAALVDWIDRSLALPGSRLGS